MRKAKAMIIGLALLCSLSFGASSAAAQLGSSETILPVVKLLAFMTIRSEIPSKELSVPEPFALAETALPAANLSPLMALDLYPTPVVSQPKRQASTMNLDPRAAVLNAGFPIRRADIRLSSAGDTLFGVSLLSMAALNVADFLSTKECLKYPGLSEGNPLMKSFVKDPYVFAAAKVAFTAFSYWNMKHLYKKSKPLGWAASIAANLALAYVVSNNYRLLGQAKAIARGR